MKPYVGVIIWAVVGLLTLIPAAASKPSLLGYYSLCTFAPISTLILWAIAVVSYRGAQKKLQEQLVANDRD